MDEFEKKAKDWAKSAKKAGKSDSEIRQDLSRRGYSEDSIKSVLGKKNVLKYLLIAVAAIIIIAAIYFAAPFVIQQISSLLSSSENCETTECFITAANSCKSATFEQTEAGSIFSYSTSGCILTKTAKTLNEAEPQEMKDLLEGKSMVCSYNENTFNENWINSLSVEIENCSGDLKDALDILIATI